MFQTWNIASGSWQSNSLRYNQSNYGFSLARASISNKASIFLYKKQNLICRLKNQTGVRNYYGN
jgi:hypothetical protein